MPYIRNEDKSKFDKSLLELPDIKTDGELNYLLTQLAIKYCDSHDLCYQTFADVMSAFSGADKEFYRRVIAPYEQQKISQNGDCFPDWITDIKK